jgi:SAM-dependent methyltransferase
MVLHRAEAGEIRLDLSVDFALAFWMVHEVPDQPALFAQVYNLVRPGGHFLMVEPALHERGRDYQKSVELALAAGFVAVSGPRIRISQATLFQKTGIRSKV